MSTTPKTLDMASILADRSNRVVVCCGAGGVGKTTTAAAMALRAAEYGRKVVVLTIDPARRLAQAFGVKDLGNSPQRVPLDPEVPGELHAMMLDMRRTFDDMVLEHSEPGRARADSGESVLPDRGHVAGGHAGVHGDGEAGPVAGPGQVGSGGGRHPAVAQRARLPGRPQTVGQFHGRPAVADAAGTGPRHRQDRHRRGRAGDEGACPQSSARRCSPTLRRSCSRWIRHSAGSARRPTAPTSFSSGAAPSSSSSPRPSRTPCARRRSSSTGCRTESMPLAGLILNRTHPTLCALDGRAGNRRRPRKSNATTRSRWPPRCCACTPTAR